MRKFEKAMSVVLLLLILCGCSTGEQDIGSSSLTAVVSGTESSSQGESDSAEEGEEALSSGQILSSTHMQESWESGVEVDAEVNYIEQPKLKTYTGSLRVFTASEVADALGISLGEAVESQIIPSSPEGLVEGEYAYYKFEDESYLVCNTARVDYASETAAKVQDLLVLEGSETNGQLFLTGEDLPFATIQQAEEAAQSLIDTLAIPVIEDPVIYSLDYQSLNAENERQYQLATDLSSGLGTTFSPTKLEIAEDDACYVLVYTIALDGFPMSPDLNGVFGDGSLTPGTELAICYDEQGIAGVSFEYIPLVDTATDPEDSLSLEEILEREKEKYNSLILEGSYLIYAIRQEYIAQPVSSEENFYRFLPVWRFSVEHTYEIDKGDGSGSTFQVVERTFDIYHALTGEQLPYDIG